MLVVVASDRRRPAPPADPVAQTASVGAEKPRRRLLRRHERREQIMLAGTRAFARAGFAATSLEDVAAEAGISRDVLYRHFESKADLYRALLQRAQDLLGAATGAPEFADSSLEALVRVAAAEPAGFRLLFHHAAREPEFRKEIDDLRACMFDIAHGQLAEAIPDPGWASWASRLVSTMAIEGVIAWLDAGQPDPATAAQRIGQALGGVVEAARSAVGTGTALPPGCR
jgi:AcrR family transcriptional regulator